MSTVRCKVSAGPVFQGESTVSWVLAGQPASASAASATPSGRVDSSHSGEIQEQEGLHPQSAAKTLQSPTRLVTALRLDTAPGTPHRKRAMAEITSRAFMGALGRTPRGLLAPLPLLASLLVTDDGYGQQPRAERSRATPKVLLIGIDGVRPDLLAEVPTPNIDALAAAGWYTDHARTTTPSVSGPSWSSMLTGVWPGKHGVTDNSFSGRDYARYPSFLARAEQVRPELATFAALDWLPLAELDGGPAPLLPPTIDTRELLDGYDLGWAEADGEVVARAVRHLGEADPDALFVYLGNPDETSHRDGSIGAEYRDAIALADRHAGMLADAVRARPGYADEDWLVLISTDHGRRADGGHGGDSPEEMTIFILASGPATAQWPPPGPAFIVDVAATALDHLGIGIDPAWELDGRPLASGRR